MPKKSQGGGQLLADKKHVYRRDFKSINSFKINFQLFSKTKVKKLNYIIISILLSSILTLTLISLVFINKNVNAFLNTDNTSFVTVNELWNGTTTSDDKTINRENFDTLLKYISSDGTLNGVSTSATASNIRGYTYNGKSTDKAVVVTLGGLKWQVVYLTTDISGNKVATLWLTGNEQEAFSERSQTEGEYYGYINGGLYSDWSSNWYDSSTNTGTPYPSNLYSTSYIRVVTLNNGGQYVTGVKNGVDSSTLSSIINPSPTSAFAPFTVTSNGLTDYIVQPKNISYQTETESTINPLQNGTNNSTGYFLNNESTNRGGSYSSYNYYNTTITYAKYGEWGSDYLWLPSLSEMGASGTTGIWTVNEVERKNYDGSTTSEIGIVGSSNIGPAYASSWSRSAINSLSYYAYIIAPSGASRNNPFASNSYAVRPALHLNLSKINETLNTNFTLTLNPEVLPNGFYDDGTGLFEEYSSQYAIINIYDKDMKLVQGVKIQFTNIEDIIKTYIKKDENIYLQVIAPTFATISINEFNTSFIPIKMNANKSLLITFSISQETWFNQSIVI